MASQTKNKTEETSNYKKVEKVPLALAPEKYPAKAPVQQYRHIDEPVVILVSSGDYYRQMTICRPVGKTPLDKDSWVVFDTRDITTMSSRAVDPSAKKKEEALQVLRNQTLVDQGIYILKDKALTYATGRTIKAAAEEAKNAFDAAKKTAHASYIADMAAAKKTPKKDWKFNRTIESFWPEAESKIEDAAEKHLKTLPEYVEKKKKLSQYETMAGPHEETHQSRAIFWSGKPIPKVQVVDTVALEVTASFDGTRAAGGPRRDVILAAFEEAGDDPEKLKKFIFSFSFPFLGPAQ
jgi:hypoxanthine phosphoribosyltransferase